MTEPTSTPTPSLRQQRMTLDRRVRLWARWSAMSVILATLFVVMLIGDDTPSPLRWFTAIAWAAWTVGSLLALLHARRAVRVFERTHGAGASTQNPPS